MPNFGWLVSYLGTNYALIIAVVVTVIALGAIAWFTKNWQAAVAALVVVVVSLLYQQIDKNAYQRRVSEEATAQVKVLQARLDVLNRVGEADAAQAAKDADEIARLADLAKATPPNAGPCLDEGAAGRIGAVK